MSYGKFFESEIKSKIFSLNNYTAKQVKLEFQRRNVLLKKEVFDKKRFRRALFTYSKSIFRVLYKTSKRFIWYGLNDKVIADIKIKSQKHLFLTF